ncbi:hypothetical protein KSP39_PZI000250 [Platanthera zijinensis]|uniref:Uncharacterized protein n=1 Tax=Platanthera zijinensis TaxID=2320716 RepID=A0AAP0BZX8_9ASPA
MEPPMVRGDPHGVTPQEGMGMTWWGPKEAVAQGWVWKKVSFKKKHEIHSIYVRSSARIYEIYYAAYNNVDSNEYLCTVQCGAAVQENTSAVLPWTDSNRTTEDDWVEIKVPDSLLQNQYEATAEISDSIPCMSVTLRLLSLQIKTSVCIEEIFIFADPTEDNYLDPPITTTGAGSLLSMLVPGLLHLSKSGRFQPRDQSFSVATAGSNFSTSTDKATDACFPDMSNISKAEASSMKENSIVGLDPYHISKLKADANLGVPGVENALDEPIGKKLADAENCSDQSRNATSSETNDVYVHFEKILGDLISRVERIENVCLSFQKSILKPLNGIDNRLQRMEEQLYAFSKASSLPSETDPRLKISCLSDHNPNIENDGCVRLTASMESSYHEAAAAVDGLMVPLPDSFKNPGLIVKAPEFPDEDDDGDDDGDDDESTSNSNSVDLVTKECPPKSKLLSIDRALSSALTAFITSTTDRSYVHDPNPMDVPTDQQFSDNHSIDSSYGAVLSVVEWVLDDKNCDASYEVPDITLQRNKSFSNERDLDNTVQKTAEWVLEDKNCDVSNEVPVITLQRNKSFSDAHDLDNTVQKTVGNKSFSDAHDLDNTMQKTVEWVLEDKNCDVSNEVPDITLQRNKSFSDAHDLDNTVQKTVEWVLEDQNCDVSYEVSEITLQRNKSFSDAHDLDNTLQKNIEWVLEDKNCDVSQDKHLRRNKSFTKAHDLDNTVLKTVEWVLEDKNCDVSNEVQDMITLQSNKSFSETHNFDRTLQRTVQLGLKDKKSDVSYESPDIILQRNKSFSEAHDLDSTLQKTVDWFLEDKNCEASYEAQDITLRRNKSFSAADDLDITLQNNHTFAVTKAETQLNCSCDESLLLGNELSTEIHLRVPEDLMIRAPGLPCDNDVLNCSKISNFRVIDQTDTNSNVLPLVPSSRTNLSKSSSNSHDEPSKLSSDYIFIRSNLLPECFESGGMDSFLWAESTETFEVISPTTSHYLLKQVPSSISCEDDLTSNIKFNADKTLKSWLPLEVLLGEKSDGKLQNGEDSVSKLVFPPEVLNEKLDDQIESTNYANNTGIRQVLDSLVAQSLSQRSEIVDNTLLDMAYNINRSEVSGFVKDSTPNNPVCFSSKQPFSSLI